MGICVVLDGIKPTEIIFKITYIEPYIRIAKLIFILGLVLIIAPFNAKAQNERDSLGTDTVPSIGVDSLALPSDSTRIQILTDSVSTNKQTDNSVISSKIEYSADDSIVNDIENRKVYLYGNAQIKYEDINLKAAVIEYDFQNYTVYAHGVQDTSGKWIGEPDFKQGSSAFKAHAMKYNFRSKKAFVKQVQTEVIEGTLTGETVKTTDNNNVIYIRHGEYCPCEDPNAKTRFKIGKLKVIKDKKIVTGPGYMVIGKIPTPLAFPFGYFPNSEEKQAGLIFPSYGNGGNKGYFLNDLGFYVPIGDRWDTKILGDIYTRGSWGLQNITRYERRYKYSGNFDVQFNKAVTGDRDLKTYAASNAFFVRWNHRQDPKARPNSNFQASINAGSTSNFQNNLNSSHQEYLTNTFNSSISYNRGFYNSPWHFAIQAGHSQNSRTGVYNFTLPQISINRTRTMPLNGLFNDNPNQAFYEKLGLSYSSTFENRLQTTESELALNNFDALKKDFQNGMRHNIALSMPLNVGPVSISPGFTYRERWYLQTYGRTFDEDLNEYRRDTISGFNRNFDYRFNASMTTKLYGMYSFKKGIVKAVRHTITPSISYSISPDFNPRIYGFYGTDGRLTSYSPYDGTLYGGPPSGRSELMSFSLTNNLEAKVLSRRDTTSKFKKVALIDNFSISSSYDFAKDSLQLSPVQMSLRTQITKYANLSARGSFEPYAYVVNNDGRIVNTNIFLARTSDKLLSFERGQIAINGKGFGSEMYSNSAPTGADILAEGSDSLAALDQALVGAKAGMFENFTVPWHFNFGYTLTANRGRQSFKLDEGYAIVDSIQLVQALIFSGDFELFNTVSVNVNSGYDFVNKEFTPTVFNVRVDLNCWEFRARVIPFGDRRSYSLSLNIKSSMLRDLKLEKKGNFNDDSNYYF